MDYRNIAFDNLNDADFCIKHEKYRTAAFFLQQYAENSAKALMVRLMPSHKLLKSSAADKILVAYDDEHISSQVGDMVRYLSSFYIDVNDDDSNIDDITEAEALQARYCADELEVYFQAELDAIARAEAGMTGRSIR